MASIMEFDEIESGDPKSGCRYTRGKSSSSKSRSRDGSRRVKTITYARPKDAIVMENSDLLYKKTVYKMWKAMKKNSDDYDTALGDFITVARNGADESDLGNKECRALELIADHARAFFQLRIPGEEFAAIFLSPYPHETPSFVFLSSRFNEFLEQDVAANCLITASASEFESPRELEGKNGDYTKYDKQYFEAAVNFVSTVTVCISRMKRILKRFIRKLEDIDRLVDEENKLGEKEHAALGELLSSVKGFRQNLNVDHCMIIAECVLPENLFTVPHYGLIEDHLRECLKQAKIPKVRTM